MKKKSSRIACVLSLLMWALCFFISSNASAHQLSGENSVMSEMQHSPSWKIPDALPPEGLEVPLMAAYGGFRNVRLIGFGHNNLTPKFVLYENKFQFKLFRARYKSYTDIQKVDISRMFSSHIFNIDFKDSIFSFSGNVVTDRQLREVIRFFSSRGVPLSTDARAFLNEATE